MKKQKIKWYVDLAETRYRTEKFKGIIEEAGTELSRFIRMIKDPDIFSPYLGEEELKVLEIGTEAGHRPFFVEERDRTYFSFESLSRDQYEEVKSMVEPLLPKALTDEASKLREKVETIKRDRFDTLRKSEYIYHLETIDIILQESFDRLRFFPKPSAGLTVLTEGTPIVISRKSHRPQDPGYRVDKLFTSKYDKLPEAF
ncbi:MAG: hypothetical protein ISS01_00020 [Nanoarchaeota archaeon]|nr:hypothetical protein [Nanoarchaeota archaeon]